MAYNEALTIKVRQALADVPKVEEKRMFRGVVFMVDGKMCITAGDEELMFRIDPELHDAAVEKPGVRAVMMAGRMNKAYVKVHTDVLKTKRQWDYWVGLALDFNKRAKASPKKKKKTGGSSK